MELFPHPSKVPDKRRYFLDINYSHRHSVNYEFRYIRLILYVHVSYLLKSNNLTVFNLFWNIIENQFGQISATPKSTKSALLEYDPDGRLLEKTLATVDRLWSITEDLNILYRENWTHLAQLEMRNYQDQIVRALRKAMLEEKYSFRQTWTFPMSLLYALTLVTTIGEENIINMCK